MGGRMMKSRLMILPLIILPALFSIFSVALGRSGALLCSLRFLCVNGLPLSLSAWDVGFVSGVAYVGTAAF